MEHTGGAFPFWLAPEQAVIVPVNNEPHLAFCRQLQQQLQRKEFRARIDDRNESMGLKTRQTQKAKIPFMLVIGDREIENNSVSIRRYGENKSSTMTIEQMFELFGQLNAERLPKELRE